MTTETFCAIDFETANGKRGSVCSIGLVKLDAAGNLLDAFSTLIQPPPGLDEFAWQNMRVHRISPRKVKDANAPTWPSVLSRLLTFVGDDLLVAHNAAFERGAIREATTAYGLIAPELEIVCTVKLAKALLPGLANHKLPTVVDHLGVPLLDHHDALADAAMCGLVAQKLLARATPGTSLTTLANTCGHQIRPRRLF